MLVAAIACGSSSAPEASVSGDGSADAAAAAVGSTFVLAFVDGNSGVVMSQTWNGSWAPEVT